MSEAEDEERRFLEAIHANPDDEDHATIVRRLMRPE